MSVTNNVDTSENYDAQQTVEEIEGGDRKAPSANIEADYEASKKFSVSEIDRTEEGAAAAAAATAPQHEMPEPNIATSSPDTTGNPDDYKEMAADLGSARSNTSNVSDDLVKKALEKGTAAD
ncbi:hypothetical protein [Stenomitos frigidus]|uniref:Uncharacterized protein n=1 Tax=Stenomitos frigidus ULC18 TaxID=2107698 RepID=A0A2T1E309_9CYAN|nr:hypothetical protein [Stenomitos frigidus]PSB27004.1 hypothetical protein C7B82_17765 [Stenomitos frigidus ULC18]